jgi:hypothetical protein
MNGGITSMKKARLLLPLFLLFVVPVTGQVEHAATPEQCRADANAWGIPGIGVFDQNEVQFANLPATMVHNQTVSAKTLEARNAEFMQCEKTDTVQANRYALAARAYGIAELARMADYMERHSLTAKFYQEDEEGKR